MKSALKNVLRQGENIVVECVVKKGEKIDAGGRLGWGEEKERLWEKVKRGRDVSVARVHDVQMCVQVNSL